MSPLLGTAGGSPLVVHIPEHLFDVRSDHAFGMPGSGLTPGSAFLPLGIAHNPRLQLGFRRDTHTLSVPPRSGVKMQRWGRAQPFRQLSWSTSEKRYKVLNTHRGLPEHRAQRPRSKLSVKRDDRSSALGVAELHMTAALADLDEPGLTERRDHTRSGNDRKAWAHAAISTEAMIGGSPESGSGASSK